MLTGVVDCWWLLIGGVFEILIGRGSGGMTDTAAIPAAKSGSPSAPNDADGQPAAGADLVPLNRSPGFWMLMGYAVVFGVVIAFAALIFLALMKGGTHAWFTLPKIPGWGSGHLWWIAVTAGAGLLVGALRRAFRFPDKIPGTVQEMKEARVEPSTVLQKAAISVVSLAGGASLGPEAAVGAMGGGLGTWVSERRKLSDDLRAANTLSGMSAGFGALLSAPYLATMLITEVGRPKSRRLMDVLIAGLLSSTVAFAVFFPIAGDSFVGLYHLAAYKYHDWQLAAAIPIGLLAGAIALITVVAIGLCTKVAGALIKDSILRALVGGILFGLIGVALPLTLFTGDTALTTVVAEAPILGAGLLVAVVFAKILTFALCQATGFIGGPFFVALFIGGTAGAALHLLIPGLPEALCVTTMMAAMPGALVAAPFSLLLLVVLVTQVGTLETAPVAIAVLTAYLAVSGSGVLMALIRKGQQNAAPSDGATAAKPAPSTP
jgi:H+/Cl- antiporter ClcA